MNVKEKADAYAFEKQSYNPRKNDFRKGKVDKNDKYSTHCRVEGTLHISVLGNMA